MAVRPKARRPPDAGSLAGRCQPSPSRGDDTAGPDAPPGQRSGAAQFRGNRAGPALGRRHHVHPTLAGFLFLAVVLDAWSRRIVGWAFASDLKTRLVLDALDMALHSARPGDVIHHSDKGSQYTSLAFGSRCRDAGVRPSMGSVGDAYDNAMCESFFATLECELLDRHRFRSHTEARMTVFHFIEGFYNPSRRHSALGYLSPLEYERKSCGLIKPT